MGHRPSIEAWSGQGTTFEISNGVYQDIAFDKVEPADRTVAQALFDSSRAETETVTIRDTTRNLVEAPMLDMWPRSGAIVDFGLKTKERYEVLYYPLRQGDIVNPHGRFPLCDSVGYYRGANALNAHCRRAAVPGWSGFSKCCLL
jgi:hypothetical protein